MMGLFKCSHVIFVTTARKSCRQSCCQYIVGTTLAEELFLLILLLFICQVKQDEQEKQGGWRGGWAVVYSCHAWP